MSATDFTVLDGGSVVLLTPMTDRAVRWIAAHVLVEVAFGPSVPIERRFIADICAGILSDGITIEKDGRLMVAHGNSLVLGEEAI